MDGLVDHSIFESLMDSGRNLTAKEKNFSAKCRRDNKQEYKFICDSINTYMRWCSSPLKCFIYLEFKILST